jgi:acyl CoA:acetate/3-ketoacid CoA transferase
VNVSKLGGLTVGPGGFMDIAQNAKKVVFCGTFDAKGGKLDIGNGRLTVTQHGGVRKLVKKVEQITYSGSQALKRGHQAVFVTERAVFRLTEQGIVLAEVAPGVDIRRDILDRMDFAPLIPREPLLMDSAIFRD